MTGAEVAALAGALTGPAARLIEGWLAGTGPEPRALLQALAAVPGFSASGLARARAHARAAKAARGAPS